MVKLIKEAKRFQELAGINEIKIQPIASLADFLNANFSKFVEKFGDPQTKFTDIEIFIDDDTNIKIATAGVDDNGIDVSINPKFKETFDIYNKVEEVEFLGKKIYVDNYLNPPEDEDE